MDNRTVVVITAQYPDRPGPLDGALGLLGSAIPGEHPQGTTVFELQGDDPVATVHAVAEPATEPARRYLEWLDALQPDPAFKVGDRVTTEDGVGILDCVRNGTRLAYVVVTEEMLENGDHIQRWRPYARVRPAT